MSRKRRFPHRPQRSGKNYVRFLVIAILLMFLVDYFFFKDGRPYVDDIVTAEESVIPSINEETVVVTPEEGGYFEAEPDPESDIVEEDVIPQQPEGFYLEDDEFFFEDFFFAEEEELLEPAPLVNQESKIPEIPEIKVEPDEALEKQSAIQERGKIAIVIDDMGMNLKQSRAAIALPSEITLAFLPYAEKVKQLSAQAREEGHELIIHAPMEAVSSDVPLGDMALRENMDGTHFALEFNRMALSFDGYVGVNNHMGSKLTQNAEHMGYLMNQLKARDLYFLDSRTIHTSVAMDVAAAYGVPIIERDVFLDHEESDAYVLKALQTVEKIARDHGSAVAIGHPKEITMRALQKWIPTLEKRGFELVPLSDLIQENQKTVMRQN
ncbi:MAG: divergent polysaccharide deacetylase family protein [Pseudomonadota bacterium]